MHPVRGVLVTSCIGIATTSALSLFGTATAQAAEQLAVGSACVFIGDYAVHPPYVGDGDPLNRPVRTDPRMGVYLDCEDVPPAS